jgi:hypothetical protein
MSALMGPTDSVDLYLQISIRNRSVPWNSPVAIRYAQARFDGSAWAVHDVGPGGRDVQAHQPAGRCLPVAEREKGRAETLTALKGQDLGHVVQSRRAWGTGSRRATRRPS